MKMSNNTYDILKWAAMVGIPAATTFYGVIGSAFNVPYTEEVIKVAVAFDAMLGTMLGVSTVNYNKNK